MSQSFEYLCLNFEIYVYHNHLDYPYIRIFEYSNINKFFFTLPSSFIVSFLDKN